MKKDELQSILNYLLTIHEVRRSIPAQSQMIHYIEILLHCATKTRSALMFYGQYFSRHVSPYLKYILQSALQLAEFFAEV